MFLRTLIKSLLNSNNQNLKITEKRKPEIAEKRKPVDESTGKHSNNNLKKGLKLMNDNTHHQNSDQHKKSFDNPPLIPEPNYTQIPNVIFDYWMQRLSPGEFKVLLCICRKTFGWHKTTDSISRSQIIQCTGLSKNKVKDAIDELERLSLLKISKENNSEKGHLPNRYQLNIHMKIDTKYTDPEDQKTEKETGRGRSLTDQGVGHSLTKGLGHSVTIQKKDITKERQTKGGVGDLIKVDEPKGSLSSPSANDVFVFFLALLKKRNPKMKQPDRKTWLTDIDKIIRIDKRTVEELKEVLTWAFNQEDHFWPTAIQSPITLRKLFDRAWTKMHHKSKDKREKDENAQKLRRIAQNKQWTTTILGGIKFRDTKKIMKVRDGCVEITNGKEWTPIGFAETNFKTIILKKLIDWGYIAKEELIND